MRRFIILGLLAAFAAPVAVFAQSSPEIRRDRRDVRQEQRELQGARRSGDRSDIREERRDVQGARQELREDRRDYRRGNRTAYTAPYRGWSYRPVPRGYRLQPAFYGQRYVIANPRQYRLPPAARNARWVRYGGDLLLVNMRNGRVLRVLRNRYR